MNKGFSLVVAKNLIDSSEQFPVDFDLAWKWLEYSTKGNAKRFLIENFEEKLDFIISDKPTTMRVQAHPEQEILLTIECLKMWGMMCGTLKGKEVRKYFLECERIAKAKVTEPPKLNIYARRVQIASKWEIPKGYWCVFHEISLLANTVGELYHVNQYDLIDGSVGKCWSNYRKDKPWAIASSDFLVSFGDKRDSVMVFAKCYQEEELIYFRRWLRSDYEASKMVKYLTSKYGQMVKV